MVETKKQLLREFYALCPKGYCEDLLEEHEKQMVKNGDMFLTGVLQKADETNGNGRVYPRSTLEREVSNYQKLINENRAIGECVDPETQIMTKEGWKYIKNIANDEEVFILDQNTNEIRIEKIEQKIENSFKGNLLLFENDKHVLNMCLTPNHKVLINKRNGEYEKIFAEDLAQNLYENADDVSHSSIRKLGGSWSGIKQDEIVFGSKTYKMNNFCAFMGIFLSEGCSSGGKIVITQKKTETTKQIRQMLKDGGFSFTESTRKTGTTDFYFNMPENRELYDFLKPLGKSFEKYIPQNLKEIKAEYLEEMLKWMLIGDGRNRSRALKKEESVKRLHRECYTTSKRLANDISEIFFKLNSSASILERIQKDREIEGRLIETKNSRLLYIISEHSAKSISLDKRFIKISKIPYDGKVYCVKTSTGNWLMKRKDSHPIWTSNCDHPEESVINLKNVSHTVTKLWWDGNNIMGKIKILNTPSGNILKTLVRDGITLGISSRSLGSVTESKGKTIVEDDLQLICFDIVSEPSVPTAFLSLSESKKIVKTNRLQSLLKEILK